MPEFLFKIMLSLLMKLANEMFLGKILVYSLGAWAKQTDNAWDDKVVWAMADALGVKVEELKSLIPAKE